MFGLSASSQAAATRVTVPSYFLNSVVVSAVTVLIATFVGEFRVAWGPLTAAGTILLLPGLLVTYWAQRHFVRGLTFGAIKS